MAPKTHNIKKCSKQTNTVIYCSTRAIQLSQNIFVGGVYNSDLKTKTFNRNSLRIFLVFRYNLDNPKLEKPTIE